VFYLLGGIVLAEAVLSKLKDAVINVEPDAAKDATQKLVKG
jgi:hypothetical protein